ncbi:unnamed protein product [Rhizoctonia solani]|uniref:Laminin domain protein n=1 Tax=Rhizoctonia solani TaxID=456999 RepID=A0A8H3DNW7_9AGAM|nr:unnamed protein product [Rhizoctonia solani]
MSAQTHFPPELPPYLKSVYDLKPIVGIPSGDELIGIHAVIRMAQKAVDIPGTGNPALLSRLYEHLFDIQIAQYRNRWMGVVFPETITYTPPILPAHVAVRLEPVTGTASEEEVVKVQSAIRSYHQFANVPTLFDPRVDMELSQHLFDLQMTRYTVRAKEYNISHRPPGLDSSSTGVAKQHAAVDSGTNNAGTGANVADFPTSTQPQRDVDNQVAIERSNRLVEQTNQLMERSNQIAERANQLVDDLKHSYPLEQSNILLERFNQLFERLDKHLDQSNQIAKESVPPVEKIGEVLGNINRVLTRIQHAIIRSHKGNTVRALECLVNEKGETPSMSRTTENRTYSDFSVDNSHCLPVAINGVFQNSYMSDSWLGEFVRFYGIDEGLFDNATTVHVKAGKMDTARVRLSEYLTSCLG